MVPSRLSEPPRLLFCSFDVVPSPSGNSRRLTSFVQAAAEKDRYQVVILSLKTADHSHIERYHGARLLRVPVGSGDLSSRISAFDRAVRRQVDSEEYAVAHFCDPFGGYPLCELRGNAGYRLIYDAVGFPSLELGAQHPHIASDRRFLAKIRRQELYCLMNSDRVVTGSEITRRFIEQLGVSAANLSVVRTPVDLAGYPPGSPTPDREPMKVLYLGSELTWQGLPLLLRAVEKALPRAPMQLTLLSPPHPDWHGQLEDLISEKGLGGVVTLKPPVPQAQLPAVVLEHDVCVAPLEDNDRNRLQGGALAKVSEALGAGRPIVAADLPLARELCPIDGSLFFKAGDVTGLADRLVELSHNPRLRAALGASCRAYGERYVDQAKITAAQLRLVDELVAAGPRRPDEQSVPPPSMRALRDERDPPKTDPAHPFPAPARRKPLRPNLPGAGTPTAPLTPTGAAPLAHIAPPEAAATPAPAPPASVPPPPESEPILSADDLAEPADEPELGALEADGPVDPWTAQLLFGYCPPEGAAFARHTPPTNFPGRDEDGEP